MVSKQTILGAFALCFLALPAARADDETPLTPPQAEENEAARSASASEQPGAPIDEARPNFIKQIGLDFKTVFTTKENLWIIGAGAGAALLARPFEGSIPQSRFNTELFEGGKLDATFEPGAAIGGTLFQVGGAAASFAIGKVTKNAELESVGRDLIRAQIVTQGLTQAIKFSVGRTRPDGSSQTSFPSGHSATTFATATVLQRHYGWKAGVPAYAVAGYVAASRLADNKHYLSDVLFGAALGIVGGRAVTLNIRGSEFALSPMFVPGGAGVQISLVH